MLPTCQVCEPGEDQDVQQLQYIGSFLHDCAHHVGDVAGEQAGSVDNTHRETHGESIGTKQQVEHAGIGLAIVGTQLRGESAEVSNRWY